MNALLRLFASGVIPFLSIYPRATAAATLDEWRSRTIYQVLTDRFARPAGSTTAACNVVDGLYCGGSWSGIVDKLDYIQGMNFDAIWISPVVKQLPQRTADGEAYTGYWAQDLYSLNSNFGTKDDLQELVTAVHQRGMFLMMDVVVNHMAYAGEGKNVDYSDLIPFDDKKYFHDYCTINGDANQTEVEVCWIGGDSWVALADLRTEDQVVQDMLGEWISSMVSNYSIDGIRIDTTVNVDPQFFPDFVDAAGVFATGEAMDGDNVFVCRWADTIGSILNYPIYYPLTRAFNLDGSINDLVATIYTMHENCPDPTAFGVFSENHDVPRFTESTNDTALAKNILAFTIMSDGIPIIYQGQEQHMAGGTSPYTNRAPLWTTNYDTDSEFYKHIATLVLARQHILQTTDGYATLATEVVYQDYHSFAMRRGKDGQQVITVLNNNGEASDDFKLHVQGHGFPSGTHLTDILTCTDIKVDHSGVLNVRMGAGLPKVMYPTKLLADSGLCGNSKPDPVTTVIATTYETTVGGQPTMVSTSFTTTASATPTHTQLALGAASHTHIDATTLPVLVAMLSMTILASSGACFIFW